MLAIIFSNCCWIESDNAGYVQVVAILHLLLPYLHLFWRQISGSPVGADYFLCLAFCRLYLPICISFYLLPAGALPLLIKLLQPPEGLRCNPPRTSYTNPLL
ncbi:hypothetical protein AVEN_36211-1 [Araneus ventricosus]|uniref:Uncharacterized protein n=1 Tax=Araneus ventricosus TaxID=182803 RepID=A0A4Y2KJN7_ARAVE|nr:hypothetical protein AVEN_36211-1 [Araneus ventricosus]